MCGPRPEPRRQPRDAALPLTCAAGGRLLAFHFLKGLSAANSALCGRRWCLAVAALLFAAVGAQAQTDYDDDNDRLIDIRTLAQLNAIRWDLDGNGTASSGNATNYSSAFPNAASGMGCPSTGCIGYELRNDLNFDTNGDGDVTSADSNTYTKWTSIVGDFTAILDGKHHVIANLTSHNGSGDPGWVALFDETSGTIRNLGLANVDLSHSQTQTETAPIAIRINNGGKVIACWASGRIHHSGGVGSNLGGLVTDPVAGSRLAASWSTVSLTGSARVAGGLAAGARGTVVASYSANPQISTDGTHGNSSGFFNDPIGSGSVTRASYSRATGFSGNSTDGCCTHPDSSGETAPDTYIDSDTTGDTNPGLGNDYTTSQLQTPTTFTGIYANWDDLDVIGDGSADEDPWDLGSSTQWPVISYNGMDTARQFNIQTAAATPAFAAVTDKTVFTIGAITPIRLQKTAGNGPLTYTVTGLPPGLAFRGSGSGTCGTTNTICGTPTTAGSYTVNITATDHDDNYNDKGTGSFNMMVLAEAVQVIATDPSPLVEGSLNGATVTVQLTGTTFGSGVTSGSFTLTTDVSGLTLGSVATVSSGDATATLTLAHTGADFDAEGMLTVTVAAAATQANRAMTTPSVAVLPRVQLTLSPTSLSLAEAAGATNANVGTYTVAVADAPSGGNTTVTVASPNRRVTVDSDGSPLTRALTFTPSALATPQTVTVTAQQDDDAADDTVMLTHSVSGRNRGTVRVDVADDDAGVVVVDADETTAALEPGPLALGEGDNGTYAVRLSARPTGDVAVSVTSDDTGAVAVFSGSASLTFTTANWNTAQTVGVTAQNEAGALDESATIIHAATGGGYNGTTSRLRVIVSDDERTGTDYDTDEDGLIEISTLAQLHAVRWDLNGDGAVAVGNQTNYNTAFPGASAGMGCPAVSGTATCTGYELVADLDFDTDGDGATHTNGTGDSDDDYDNAGVGWSPIGSRANPYIATFDGNGHMIHNLYVNRVWAGADAGLFSATDAAATIRSVGLTDAYVASINDSVGPLVGRSLGRIEACWASGAVSGRSGIGGLIGTMGAGTVVASYSTASVTVTGSTGGGGGLTSWISAGSIAASYASGAVTGGAVQHGLAGGNGGTVTASYWDTEASGNATSARGDGRSTSQLRTPTSATGPYAGWDALDVDGDGDPAESPWDFGTDSEYPVLRVGANAEASAFVQRGDYDLDDDGLIDIHTLAQLDAIRWDLDGDGSSSDARHRKAFRHHRADMGCPGTGCRGYELMNDLDFDTNGNGHTHTNGTADSGDAYSGGGAGWAPIGNRSNPYTAVFDGKGHVIDNVFVNRQWAGTDAGLISSTSATAVVRAVGLPDAYAASVNDVVGPLVGYNRGRVAACWVTGSASGRATVGGLVGEATGAGSVIVASYSTASVTVTRSTNASGGGLAALNDVGASIAASYATGAVTGGTTRHGLANGPGTVVASYWDTTGSGIMDDNDADPPEGRSRAQLRAPTGYTGIYADWDDQDVDGDGTTGVALDSDDDAWSFGDAFTHPVLKYGGFDANLQFGLQPNVAPTFTGTLQNVTVANGHAIDLIQAPTATGGEGVGYTYSATGLPTGLVFDEDGTGTCQQARTICGAPSGSDGAATVTVYAHDGDVNRANSDRAALTFTLTVTTPTAAITATSPAALTENNLDNATVTVTLTNTTFGSGVTLASFTLNTNVPGASIDSVATVSAGDTAATLTLDYTGQDFDTARTLSVTVAASAHALAGALSTATVAVAAGTGVRVAPPSLSLSEDPAAGGAANANVGTYSLVLESQPAGNVTVTATSADAAVTLDADGTPLTYALTFTTTSWETAQLVTATAAQDDDAADESVQVTHAVTGYPGVTTATAVTVAVDDDETAGVVIDADPSSPATAEAGPVALAELASATNNSLSYTVRLTAPPTAAVTVTATSADTDAVTVDTDAAAGLQSALRFTSTNWATAQAVTLEAQQDADGVNESVVVTNAATTAAMGEYANVSATVTATVADDEAPGFVFDSDPSTPAMADAAPLNLDELSGSGTNSDDYTVRLSSQPTQAVTVTVTSPDTGAVTVGASTLTFTTSNWATAQAVTLTAQQDDDGADESVDVEHAAHTATASEYTGVSATFEAAVDDDETPAITLSLSSLNVNEQDGGTYRVALATEPTGAVTVAITGAGSGISADPTSLTFTASNWATARTVTASAADDQDSVNEMVTLTHRASGAREYDTLTEDLEVTAQDDDRPGLRVSPPQLTVHENGSAGYTIRLNTEPTSEVTVTVGGTTAEVTVDADGVTAGNQTELLFDATNWSAARTVTVSAADDDDATDESVSLTHATAGGDYTGLLLAARPGVSVTIDDDDEPGLLLDADPSTPGVVDGGPLTLNELSGHADNEKGYTVRLATEPTGSVTVEVSSGDRAVHVDAAPTPRMRTLTFTTTNWSMPQTVTATAAEDDDASDEDVAISHSASGSDYAGVSADLRAETTDDDTPALVVDAASLTGSGLAEGAAATYTVRLDTEPTGRVLVSASAQGGVSVDADSGQSGLQPTLWFDAADWNVPQTVTVRARRDDDGASATAVLRHSASGADYGGVTAAPVSFAVTDADAPAVRVSALTLEVNEGSAALYQVSLATRPFGGAVTVALSSSSALATVSSPMLVFTASDWSAPRQVTVQGTTDGTATLSHMVSGADYGSVSQPTVTVTVRDSDAAGVRVDPPQLLLREGDTGSYRVRLNTAPSGTVTVTTSAAAGLSLVGGGTLLFTASDWSLERTVSVTAADDDDPNDGTLTVTHGVSGYAGVSSAPTLDVLVSDDDVPGFVFAPGGLSLSEGGGVSSSATYRVRLATPPTGQVMVTASSDDAGLLLDTDGTPQTLSLTFTTTNWSSAQTVSVRAVADGDRVSETAVLLHEGSGGGYDGASGLLRVRVKDSEARPPRPDPPSSVLPPEVAGLFEDLELDPGESVLLDLSGKFRDDGPLRHAAQSSDPSVATAVASESGLRIAGLSPGVATVTVTATDLDGLSVSQSFVVSVGRLVSFASAWASAREGGTLRLELSLSRPAPSSGLTVSWTGGADGDPSTADADAADLAAPTVADAGDLGVLSGTAEFAPGGTEAFIEISVLDDDDVEPAREYLSVSLAPPPEGTGWALGLSEATLEIQEGVCDRTPAVREALRGARECWAPTPLDLSRRGYLGLHRLGLSTLRAGDLQGLSRLRALHLHGNRLQSLPTGLFEGLASLERLRLDGNLLPGLPEGILAGLGRLSSLRLDGNRLTSLPPNLLSGAPGLERLNLSDNRLESLPPSLFAGVANLSELNLEGNPGAPFALVMRLARTDAEPWAPGPASVEARVAEGAPFALSAEVLADGAELSSESASVPAGALAGPPLQAEQTGPGAARLSLSGMPQVPQGQCGDVQDGMHPCFRGLSVQAGPPLVLFKPPPGTTDEPPMPTLSANGERASFALDALFSPSEAGDRLSYEAESDRPDLVGVRIHGDALLLLVANEDGAEGTAVVTVTATDPDGQSATLSFSVTVEFAPPRLLRSWRLEWLRGLQEATQ